MSTRRSIDLAITAIGDVTLNQVAHAVSFAFWRGVALVTLWFLLIAPSLPS